MGYVGGGKVLGGGGRRGPELRNSQINFDVSARYY